MSSEVFLNGNVAFSLPFLTDLLIVYPTVKKILIYIRNFLKNPIFFLIIQGVTEISALILTGNRTHQKEQLFSLPFWRKTLRNGLKK
jgi:hypothetical protein